MKLSKKMIGASGLALMLGMMMVPVDSNAKGRGMGNGGNQQNGFSTIVSNLPMQDLSSLEEIGLTKMREEEKLARDVYQALHDKWGHQVFSNIAQSEQQHMNAIHALLEKYSLEDPAAGTPAGVFNDQELQGLYDSLVEQGEQSLVEAFKVGATIEDLDIKDLYDFLEQTDNTDIKTVYQNLVKGSRNHLRSFCYQLSLNGANYEAQFLTAAQINDIISSPRERGRVDENGKQVTGKRNFSQQSGHRAWMRAGNTF